MRNKKLLSLVVIASTPLLLWLTHDRWLPILLSILPPTSDKSKFIGDVNTLLSIATTLNTFLFLPLVNWLRGAKNKEQKETADESPVLFLPAADLLEEEKPGVAINWIDRHQTNTGQLHAHGKVAITGHMKIGKTREARELIRRAIAERMITSHRIIVVSSKLEFIDKEKLQGILKRTVNPQLPILLYLDDFTLHFPPTLLEHLSEILKFLSSSKEAYVVATGRTDQLTAAHSNWLKQHNFLEVQLSHLDAEQTGELIDSASKVYNLQVSEQAKQTFIKQGDGTPALTLISLRRLSVSGQTDIDEKTAEKFAHDSLADSWASVRRYISERRPAAKYLLEALATFHVAKIPAFKPIILSYSAYLWRLEEGFWKVLRPFGPLNSALTYVDNFEIIVRNETVLYPDVAVEGLFSLQAVSDKLKRFLHRDGKLPNSLDLVDAQRFVLAKLPYLVDANIALTRDELEVLGPQEKLRVSAGEASLIQRSEQKALIKDRLEQILTTIFWPAIMTVGSLAIIFSYSTGQNILTLFWGLVILFGLIGARRGWAAELLSCFGVILALLINHLLVKFVPVIRDLAADSVSLFWIRTLILVTLLYFGYQSIASIRGLRARAVHDRLQDGLFGVIMGAINGYLSVGTLWFYLHTANYPYQNVLPAPPDSLSGVISQVMSYMPPNLVGEPGIYFATILIFVFVIIIFV
jgi:hypothetical protein